MPLGVPPVIPLETTRAAACAVSTLVHSGCTSCKQTLPQANASKASPEHILLLLLLLQGQRL